jgi:hypothetical protein
MGRSEPGQYSKAWTAPDYCVGEDGKIVGAMFPKGQITGDGGDPTTKSGPRT